MKLATNKKSLLSVLLLSLLSSFPQAAAKTKKKEEGKTKIHPKFGKALDPDALLAGITVGGGSSKILNGENATVGDYPWFTMNLFRYESSIYLAGCGASLIAPGWVLTAAHCISDYFAADPLVLIGALSPYETGNGGQFFEIIEVESVYSHPNYGVGGFLNNDFALLKLQTESTITPVDFDIAGVSKAYSTGMFIIGAAIPAIMNFLLLTSLIFNCCCWCIFALGYGNLYAAGKKSHCFKQEEVFYNHSECILIYDFSYHRCC